MANEDEAKAGEGDEQKPATAAAAAEPSSEPEATEKAADAGADASPSDADDRDDEADESGDEESGDDDDDDDEESDDADESSDDDGDEDQDEDEDEERPAAAAKGEAKSDKPVTPGERLAAAKARKARKKADKRGRSASAIETKALKRAEVAGEWARQNRNVLYGSIAAVVVVIVGATYWSIQSSKAEAAASEALWDAIEAARGEVRAEGNVADDEESEREIFESSEARAEAVTERAAKVVSHHGGTEAAVWARLVDGAALLELGRYGDAAEVFEAARPLARERPELQLHALEGLAFAHEGEEEWDEAASVYEDLAQIDDGTYRDIADYHLARIHVAKGEVDEAKELLTTLVTRLADRASEEEEEAGPDLSYVRSQAEIRLMELDPSAVPSGSGSFGGAGGAGGPGDLSPEEIQRLIQQLQQQQGGGGGE